MNIYRRNVLCNVAALAVPPLSRSRRTKVLPLRTPGLDHLDVMVPDVETTTKFDMGLFNTELHAQELRDSYR